MKLYSNIIGKEGKPLLIIHGLFGMGDNWKTLGTKFAKEGGFQVHLIDQRNHGRSPHAEEFSYEIMAKDLEEYCAEHNLEEVVIIGHSMGGKIAMQLAAQNPELIEALIVVDIAPKSYPPHHDVIFDGLSALYEQDLTSRTEADEMLKPYIENWSVRQFLLKNLYWKEKGKLAFRMNFPVLKEKYEQVTDSIADDALYEGPTFFIKGEKSGYIKSEDRDLLKKHFPKSQLLTLKDTDHWVHAEKPEDFFEAVIGFLRFNKICK